MTHCYVFPVTPVVPVSFDEIMDAAGPIIRQGGDMSPNPDPRPDGTPPPEGDTPDS